MTKKEIKELFNEAIDLWGIPAQVNMGIEESAELIQALCKMLRGITHKRYMNLCEEIADWEITISQIKMIYDVDDEIVDDFKIIKLDRLKEKLEKYKGGD